MEMLAVSTSGRDAWAEQIVASLHAECDSVREFLAAQQKRLERAESSLEELIARSEEVVENATASETNHAGDVGDYQRRYEMALDDLRDLKAGNSLLQEQLSKARASASTLAKQSRTQDVGLDWEAQKLRILAALESDLDENDSEHRAERLKIEDVIRATEKAIAEKDEEIQELKGRLEEAISVGTLAQAATAVEQAVQNDAAVREEREKLRQLEEQCQAKLCQAEIEISLERAKLARQRAELEERLRVTGLDASKLSAGPKAAGAAEQPTRSRWMSRLGLTDADREHGRHR
jgi:DNA repair exonuclease SbcCD ATPase subunit